MANFLAPSHPFTYHTKADHATLNPLELFIHIPLPVSQGIVYPAVLVLEKGSDLEHPGPPCSNWHPDLAFTAHRGSHQGMAEERDVG